jgi:hypothetical protein
MKLITRFELAAKDTQELRALYRNVFNALACTTPGTPARRNALASLENISRELAVRCAL